MRISDWGSDVCASELDAEPYLQDWRRRYRGAAQAVIRPASTDEVAQAVRLGLRHGAPVVPQGGNTGLCGGATPDDSGQAVLLSTARLNRVRAIDTDHDTITVEAGRSEARRVGQECVSKCQARWSQYHKKTNK